MAGMFRSPEEVAMLEQAHRMQQGSSANPLQGGMFNLGHSLGNAFQRSVGEDTRSPMQMQAGQISNIVRQIDFSNPQTIQAAAQSLNDSGFQQEAVQILSLMPKPTKSEVTWSEPYPMSMTVQNPDGSTAQKNIMVRKNSAGKVEEVSSITNRGSFSTGGSGFDWSKAKIHPKLVTPVQFDKFSESNMMSRLSGLPEFQSLFDDTDPETFAPLYSEFKKFAGQLKKQDEANIKNKFIQDKDLFSFQNATGRTDEDYIEEAFGLFVTSGAIEKYAKGTLTGVGGQDVAIDPFQTTNIGEMQSDTITEANKRKTQQSLEEQLGKRPLASNPNAGGFTRANTNLSDVEGILSSLGGRSMEDIQSSIEQATGTTFSPEAAESHKAWWDIMQQPEHTQFIAQWMNRKGNKQGQKSYYTQTFNDLIKEEKWQQAYEIASVNQYLNGFSASGSQHLFGRKKPLSFKTNTPTSLTDDELNAEGFTIDQVDRNSMAAYLRSNRPTDRQFYQNVVNNPKFTKEQKKKLVQLYKEQKGQ